MNYGTIVVRVVESELESVESHVFSWSRESVFKTAGVGVGFLKLLESESGVGTFVAITDTNIH